MSPFATERVLVTGGRRGLGYAFARRFTMLGANVRITSRRTDDLGPVLASLGRSAPGTASALAWDMNARDSTSRLESQLKLDPPTIVVHAAHDFHDHVPVVGLRTEDLARGVSEYVAASHALLRATSRYMMRERHGRIALLSSLAVELAPPGQATYVASKLAVEGLARVLASETHARGVGICIVRPGIVDTENVRERVPDEAQRIYASRSGLGRILRVDEVVDATLPFLDARSDAPRGTIVRVGPLAEETP